MNKISDLLTVEQRLIIKGRLQRIHSDIFPLYIAEIEAIFNVPMFRPQMPDESAAEYSEKFLTRLYRKMVDRREDIDRNMIARLLKMFDLETFEPKY